MAETDDVLVSQQEGIVTVALNKPSKRNAISFAMWRRLGELFTGFRERADVRVVILTGTEGNFSAGADISEFPERRGSPDAAKEYSEAGRAATLAIRDLPQPTIAAAHGYCVGGGCGLALACDVRVGDATTKMGIPAAKRGIVYTVLDTENLMRAVGLSRAKLVLFTGRVFPWLSAGRWACSTKSAKRERWRARAFSPARWRSGPRCRSVAPRSRWRRSRAATSRRGQPRSPRRSASPLPATTTARRPSPSWRSAGRCSGDADGRLGRTRPAEVPRSRHHRQGRRARGRRLRGLETLWVNTGTLCNVTCRNCYIESSPRNDRLAYLTRDELRGFLDEIARDALPVRLVGFTGGEPFMNPDIIGMLDDVLGRGLRALVLTNAMKPLRKLGEPLLGLRAAHGDRLALRVSIDHYSADVHEAERGRRSWAPAIDGLVWLARNGFPLDVAGRRFQDEDEAGLRAGYARLFAELDIPVDAHDPVRLMLFPEMDEARDVPEITTACWGPCTNRLTT